MASNSTNRTRSERVASLQMGPSRFSRYARMIFSGRSMLQIGIAMLAAVLVIVILEGWKPPFAFREGQIPDRTIVARVPFEVVDSSQTELLREQERSKTLCYYENQAQPIVQLRSEVKDKVFALLNDDNLDDLDAEQVKLLDQFLARGQDEKEKAVPADREAREKALERIRELLSDSEQLERFEQALQLILDPIAELGVLDKLEHESDQGNQRSIMVFPAGLPNDKVFVDVPRVRRAEIVVDLREKVVDAFEKTFSSSDGVNVAIMVSRYLSNNLPLTLTYRQDLSEQARREAEESVKDAKVSYFQNVSTLAAAAKPITSSETLPLLRAEHEAWVEQVTWGETMLRLAAFTGMVLAFYLLCGIYIFYQYDPQLMTDPVQLLRLLGTVVVICLCCKLTAPDPLRAELVPLVVGAMTLTIAFGRQVALLVSTCVALAICIGLGLGIGEFVTWCSGTCASILLLGRIRTRTKLITVGIAAGAIVLFTHLGVDTVLGQLNVVIPSADDVDSTQPWLSLLPGMLEESARLAGYTVLATALMTGILAYIEKIFGVQTDLSLLELGDASHQLLRQLAQRAPGTYNHSINVAAISEAAADSIGAHGLLTRVGAYFHDIGKMFKPNYFIENQEQGGNCHDTLQPAMSTLVIIAHVKDGADLARQHRLPKPIIDFIEQHHGTTLVEYFYREAEKRSQSDPNQGEVSETSFRYPGPKPQTLEAAVLMLADSVESASRTLVEPTSSRIQSLVDSIAMKKLLDGQFDECGLTLQQLDALKSSLVKSLTAIYHGRVKYSGQASA